MVHAHLIYPSLRNKFNERIPPLSTLRQNLLLEANLLHLGGASLAAGGLLDLSLHLLQVATADADVTLRTGLNAVTLQAKLRLELLDGIERVVDEAHTGAAATTEGGLKLEDSDLLGVFHLLFLGK